MVQVSHALELTVVCADGTEVTGSLGVSIGYGAIPPAAKPRGTLDGPDGAWLDMGMGGADDDDAAADAGVSRKEMILLVVSSLMLAAIWPYSGMSEMMPWNWR